MLIIPAIDLKQGKCVRLKQGRMDESTVFNDNPVEQAMTWQRLGAKRIHVVDLDGSVDGRPTNLRTILAISQNISVPIELGGGVRDKETAQMYLDNGVSFIILGTVAVRNPPIALDLLQSFPKKIGIGIDAKNGRVAVQGWTEGTDYDAGELAVKFDPYSPAAFIYTDIERDGMMTGPNFPATKAFAKKLKTQVILSGGVTSIDDIKTAITLENDGVTGIIIGRALYEGAVNLAEAISLTEGPSC